MKKLQELLPKSQCRNGHRDTAGLPSSESHLPSQRGVRELGSVHRSRRRVLHPALLRISLVLLCDKICTERVGSIFNFTPYEGSTFQTVFPALSPTRAWLICGHLPELSGYPLSLCHAGSAGCESGLLESYKDLEKMPHHLPCLSKCLCTLSMTDRPCIDLLRDKLMPPCVHLPLNCIPTLWHLLH